MTKKVKAILAAARAAKRAETEAAARAAKAYEARAAMLAKSAGALDAGGAYAPNVLADGYAKWLGEYVRNRCFYSQVVWDASRRLAPAATLTLTYGETHRQGFHGYGSVSVSDDIVGELHHSGTHYAGAMRTSRLRREVMRAIAMYPQVSRVELRRLAD